MKRVFLGIETIVLVIFIMTSLNGYAEGIPQERLEKTIKTHDYYLPLGWQIVENPQVMAKAEITQDGTRIWRRVACGAGPFDEGDVVTTYSIIEIIEEGENAGLYKPWESMTKQFDFVYTGVKFIGDNPGYGLSLTVNRDFGRGVLLDEPFVKWRTVKGWDVKEGFLDGRIIFGEYEIPFKTYSESSFYLKLHGDFIYFDFMTGMEDIQFCGDLDFVRKEFRDKYGDTLEDRFWYSIRTQY